ncbi:MAG: hypothetical protein IT449_09995 [Phycisphaerales bacterium]|nr:hypothetical protein [Phycisphaerales bacterium]
MRAPAPPQPVASAGAALLPGMPDPGPERLSPATPGRSTDELRKAAMRDPFVREAMARFDARLVDVTEAQSEPATASEPAAESEPKVAPLEPGMTAEADVLPVMEIEESRELD